VDRANIFAAVAGSLRRLGTDYIDLYQIHWPVRYRRRSRDCSAAVPRQPPSPQDRYAPAFGEGAYARGSEREEFTSFDDQVLAMGELLDAGTIRAWGVSNENGHGVGQFVAAAKRLGVDPPVTIQNDFSLLDSRFESDSTAEACSPLYSRPSGVGLLVYGALAGGTLTGKYGVDGTVAVKGSRHEQFPAFQARYYSKGSLEAAQQYAAVAEKHNMSPAALALEWARSREYTASVIVGATTLEQLKENLDVFVEGAPRLSREALADIDAVRAQSNGVYFSGIEVGSVTVRPEAGAEL